MTADLRCYGDDIQALADLVPDFDLRSPMDVLAWYRREWQFIAELAERADCELLLDVNNVYVSAKCWDSAPESQWVANEMRRNTAQLRQNDTFGVMFDTFYDRRNGYFFYTNPLGARADRYYTDETDSNAWASTSGSWSLDAVPVAGNRERWTRVEAAKKRAVYSLLAFGLPVGPKQAPDSSEPGTAVVNRRHRS